MGRLRERHLGRQPDSGGGGSQRRKKSSTFWFRWEFATGLVLAQRLAAVLAA